MKLVYPEPETQALVAALGPEARLVSSEISEVEVLRAVRRVAGDSTAAVALGWFESVRLLPFAKEVRRTACQLQPVELRTLDAIHLATALALGDLLEAVYAYDARLIAAARRAGLRVLAPADPHGSARQSE